MNYFSLIRKEKYPSPEFIFLNKERKIEFIVLNKERKFELSFLNKEEKILAPTPLPAV